MMFGVESFPPSRRPPPCADIRRDDAFNTRSRFPPTQDLDDIDTYDSSVINCLQDYSAEIKNDDCKVQVNKYAKLASQVRRI